VDSGQSAVLCQKKLGTRDRDVNSAEQTEAQIEDMAGMMAVLETWFRLNLIAKCRAKN
jgi:hypothetical protein